MKIIQNQVGDRVYIGGAAALSAARKRCVETSQDTYYWNGEKLQHHYEKYYNEGQIGDYGFCGSVIDQLKSYVHRSKKSRAPANRG